MILIRKSIRNLFLLVFIFTVCISCEAIFEEDISEETVVLLAPTEGSAITNGSIRFDWDGLDEAVEYEIQIATPSFDYANQILLDSITSETSIVFDLTEGDYQWRVNASNSNYSTDYSISSFTIN